MTILRFSTIGTGAKHVVVLHEWLGDHSNYDPVLPYINTKQFKWIFVDLNAMGYQRICQVNTLANKRQKMFNG